MSKNDSISAIPVVVEGRVPGKKIHDWRRFSQIGILVLAVLVPASGLFRIDVQVGAFVILDRQIWFSDFFMIIGLWLALASGLVLTYSSLGMVFCGWLCPQNSLAEWADNLTQKWLGKRAENHIDGTPMKVSQGKKKWSNWLKLVFSLLGASMLAALLPLFYFYPPIMIWEFVIFQHNEEMAGSMYWIYTICVLLIFLDIAFIRHFWCRFICVYRVWMHSFKTTDTLHIKHDDSYADECAHCNFCVTSCIVDIDPRETSLYDACINCGECINACANIRESRKSGPSLLRFEFGSGGVKQAKRYSIDTLFGRTKWTLPVTFIGLVMFSWGVFNYQPYHFSVYRDDIIHGNQILDYRIAISHKRYEAGNVNIEVEGLPTGQYTLTQSSVAFQTAGRDNVFLHINDTLVSGLYPFIVHIKDQDTGWKDSFRVHHFVGKGDL